MIGKEGGEVKSKNISGEERGLGPGGKGLLTALVRREERVY